MIRRDAVGTLSCVALSLVAGCTGSLDDTGGHDTEDVKENAETIDYEKLHRNISDHEGEPVYYSEVRITDIAESEDGYQEYIISLPDTDWGESEVLYGLWEGDPFMEDDTVNIWGVVNGTTTYTSLMGEKTVPEIDLVDLELLE